MNRTKSSVLLFAAATAIPAYGLDIEATNMVFNASAEYSVVDKGEARFGGKRVDQSETQTLSPSISGRFPLSERWNILAAIGSDDIFLDSVKGVPEPERINTLRTMVGLGWRINDSWSAECGVGPQFYDLNRVDGSAIGFGAAVRVVWKARDSLTVVGGLAVAPDSEFPVMPMAGVEWRPRQDLALSLVAPKPRITWTLLDWLDVYAGAEARFTVFRTADNLDQKTGVAGYNRALGTYRDIHLGVGEEYRIVKGLRAGIEAGYSLGRQIDYTRIDQRVRFETGAYVSATLKYRF